MYHDHWGLSRSPFAGGGDPLFYRGESQAEAMARLRYVADYRRHAVLVGERGVGKSLILRQFGAQRRREGREVVSIAAAGLSPRELVWLIAAGLSLAPRPEDDLVRLFRRLNDYALTTSSRTTTALVLLDDADQSGQDVRTQMLRLLSMGGGWSWMTLIMTAGLRSVGRLGDELLDAADLRIDLEPWSETDSVGYVQHALIEAGADRPIFEEEALAALYSLSDGIPRRVNRLADHALLGAAGEGQELVDAAMVEAAHDALSWTATS